MARGMLHVSALHVSALHVSALSMRCHDHIPAETTRATVVATSFSTKRSTAPDWGP